MNITAVVLTAQDRYLAPPLPAGVQVLVSRQQIASPSDLLYARFQALGAVRTRHFFYLDDDDALPDDIASVLEECVAAGAPLAYTDELIDGAPCKVRGPYSREAHRAHPMLVHHLALFETSAAIAATHRVPWASMAPELLLAWEVARYGAAYVPRIGYHWNRRPGGMHTWPQTTLSWARAAAWCRQNP